MLALDKADIEDIANGNHNRYVDTQDKDELLRELASRLLKVMLDTYDTNDIEDNLDNISDCLDDIDDILINNRTPRRVVVGIKQKIKDAEGYIREVKDVLQSIAQ